MTREPDRASRALPSQARATHDRATSCRTCHEGTSVARVEVKDEGASRTVGEAHFQGAPRVQRLPHQTDGYGHVAGAGAPFPYSLGGTLPNRTDVAGAAGPVQLIPGGTHTTD